MPPVQPDALEVEACWFKENVTQLNGALLAVGGTATIAVDATTGIEDGDTLAVENELMDVLSTSGNNVVVTRADSSTTAATHADNTPVSLFRRRRFKLLGDLRQQAVDRFAGKVTIGPYDKDSNDTLSAWIVGDYTGGHGIADLKEGVDDTRYRFGTIYSRYPFQLSKPYSISKTTLGSGKLTLLGDLQYSDTVYRMAASGTTLYQNTTSRGALTAAPFGRGTVFSGTDSTQRFYVPMSASGYATFNPATNTLTNNATPTMRSFLPWNDLLIGADKDGVLYYATTAANTTTFTAYTLGANNVKIDAGLRTATLLPFTDRQGNSVPFLITQENVWAFDPDGPRLYRIPDFESVHPRFGYAAAVWRGELYVSSGMDIMAFNGEVLRPAQMGLSRDDGLPYLYQGYVRSLVAAQNALYALVRGKTTGGVTYLSVHEWSGFGWHCIWTGSDADPPVNLAMSSAGDAYKLHWGLNNGGDIYTQDLPESFTNPRESIAAGDVILGDFTTTDGTYYNQTYYLETGRFDANMKGYRKIAQGVELTVRSLAAGYETIRVKYRVDTDTSWTQVGSDITAAGTYQLLFGQLDPNGFRIGLDFQQIELRFEIIDAIPNPYIQSTSAVIESSVFSFHKRMNPAAAWTADIDAAQEYDGVSADQQVSDLTEIRTLDRFFSIRHGDNEYRAIVTGQSGIVRGGRDPGAQFQLALLEIPQVLGVTA